jgi:hypothetical protein
VFNKPQDYLICDSFGVVFSNTQFTRYIWPLRGHSFGNATIYVIVL